MLLHTRVKRYRPAHRDQHARDRPHQPSRLPPDGYVVQPNKAIVTQRLRARVGIHQDGVLKERTTYEIMEATSVGLAANSLVLGKHSGRHALRQALETSASRPRPGVEHGVQRFKESPTARRPSPQWTSRRCSPTSC